MMVIIVFYTGAEGAGCSADLFELLLILNFALVQVLGHERCLGMKESLKGTE
jgi:hypothetical protein